MNVYFVNYLLACMLAYIVGFYMAHRKYTRMMAAMLYRATVGADKASVTSDVKFH